MNKTDAGRTQREGLNKRDSNSIMDGSPRCRSCDARERVYKIGSRGWECKVLEGK